MSECSHEAATPPTSPARRRLLKWLAINLGVLATFAAGLPIVGFIFSVIIKPRPDEWISLGGIGKFPEGQTRLVDLDKPGVERWDGMAKKTSAYVRRTGPAEFRVLAINCAHLGCPVSWFPQAGLFLCPCHGGVYYEDGAYAAGPPPRGLYQYDYRLVDPTNRKQVVSADKAAALSRVNRDALVLEVFGGHVPTLHDPLRQPGKEVNG